jgi:mRNA-degrading endonuclease RelE of RelBE toxin-antitoxin system
MAFSVIYSPEAFDHLSALQKSDQVTVVDSIEQQLTHEPTIATRRRKLLRPNPVAPWQLRIGDIRVFYEVKEEPNLVVQIKAIGKKIHNELWIGEERIQL